MVRPDLIITWPDNCDYPLYREWLAENRARFNQIIVVFTATNQEPRLMFWVAEKLRDIGCLPLVSPMVPPGADWRNVAIHTGLPYPSSEWILFMEQDYVVTDNAGFWKIVDDALETNNKVIAHYEGERMHPAFLLIQRSLLDNTRRDFGIIKDKADHFYKLYEDLRALQSPIFNLSTANRHAHHLNGLSSNMSLVQRGEAPNYKVDEFDKYIRDCFHAEVKLNEEWKRIYLRYFSEQGKKILA